MRQAAGSERSPFIAADKPASLRHEWERDATLQLRTGKPEAADTYLAHGRVESGTREDMLDLLFDAWLDDTRAGLQSLMIAADAQTVADLNARARAHSVAMGAVADRGVASADGNTIGVGDVVVTRLNVRALSTGRGWVKNGDDWIVRETRGDGRVRVARVATGETATLPADYVKEHLELGYASTAHRAQGRTVDTAHAYVTATTTREPLYVMATRGRESNRMYVDTTHDPDGATRHSEPEHVHPDEVLRHVIAATGADSSATQTRRAEATAARTPWRIQGQGAAGVVTRERPGRGPG
ncbi:hypothetical protein [Phycicoccus sp. Root101]|uniref:hypothetical protein n=1 Tax=Phycicoccus sp. Root101 TaxID=1736421 RepID=UPI0007027ECF|nr:hypothetical protein [Phycicoccus sp. Root101]KQU68965.1 hypothetical protein ASC58_09970 [Phycicoccus sp. Root101]